MKSLIISKILLAEGYHDQSPLTTGSYFFLKLSSSNILTQSVITFRLIVSWNIFYLAIILRNKHLIMFIHYL